MLQCSRAFVSGRYASWVQWWPAWACWQQAFQQGRHLSFCNTSSKSFTTRTSVKMVPFCKVSVFFCLNFLDRRIWFIVTFRNLSAYRFWKVTRIRWFMISFIQHAVSRCLFLNLEQILCTTCFCCFFRIWDTNSGLLTPKCSFIRGKLGD